MLLEEDRNDELRNEDVNNLYFDYDENNSEEHNDIEEVLEHEYKDEYIKESSEDKLKNNYSTKSRLYALICCVLLGRYGLHRFYVDRIKGGVLIPLVNVYCQAVAVIDFIKILIGKFPDGRGRVVYNWKK